MSEKSCTSQVTNLIFFFIRLHLAVAETGLRLSLIKSLDILYVHNEIMRMLFCNYTNLMPLLLILNTS